MPADARIFEMLIGQAESRQRHEKPLEDNIAATPYRCRLPCRTLPAHQQQDGFVTMRMTTDTRAPQIQRLEHLLEGMNYSVWIGVYGPFGSGRALEEQLRHSVSNRSVVGRETPVSGSDVRSEVLEQLLHPGDGGYGPIDLPAKRSEIIRLAEELLSLVRLDQANAINAFWLAEGHPAYSVWWDFAFDIHADGQRWILMGSASD